MQRGKGGIGEMERKKTVVLHCKAASLVAQPFWQCARVLIQHQARTLRANLRVRAIADGHADGTPHNVAPVLDRDGFRSDQNGLRLVIVRTDKARLFVALFVMAHGGDSDIDAIFC